MKTKSLTIRLSDRRKNKLYLYAAQKDKTITALIEDWIDSLKLEEKDKNFLISIIRVFLFDSYICFQFSLFPTGKFLEIFQPKCTVLVSKNSAVNLINRLVFSDPFYLWLL